MARSPPRSSTGSVPSGRRELPGLTLDTGALIAADRDDRRFWAFWKEAERRDIDVTVPAAVLAQAWRGGRNARMAMLLAACVTEQLDEPLAKATGVLCGRSRTCDIVDATVIVSAAERGDDVLTSDAGDLRTLAGHFPGFGRVLDIEALPAA